MSILDGMPTSQDDMIKAWIAAGQIIAPAVKDMELTERQKSVAELMQSGLSLADIFDITKDERDALLVQAGQLLQVGDFRKAQDQLLVLHQLEPLDERVIYMLAASHQAAGEVATAAKMYVYFLALDATNPDGHLRLGECLLAAREYDGARESFEIALGEVEAGNGRPDCADHARKMLAVVAEQQAAARSN